MIRVRDLKRYTAHEPRPLLWCSACGAEASADAGDYWGGNPSRVLRCDGGGPLKADHKPRMLRLVYKRTVYERADVAGPSID